MKKIQLKFSAARGLCLLLMLWGASANAQSSFEIRTGAGWGLFSMQEMKDLQELAASSMNESYGPYSSEINKNISDGFLYGIQFIYHTSKRGAVGVGVERGAGKGLINGKHLTGRYYDYKLIQNLQYHFFSTTYQWRHKLFGKDSFNALSSVTGGITTSKLEFVNYDGSIAYSHSFVSLGLALFPEVGIEKKLGPFNLGFKGGYLLDVNEPFHRKGEKEVDLLGRRSEKVQANWRGLRTGLFIGFLF